MRTIAPIDKRHLVARQTKTTNAVVTVAAVARFAEHISSRLAVVVLPETVTARNAVDVLVARLTADQSASRSYSTAALDVVVLWTDTFDPNNRVVGAVKSNDLPRLEKPRANTRTESAVIAYVSLHVKRRVVDIREPDANVGTSTERYPRHHLSDVVIDLHVVRTKRSRSQRQKRKQPGTCDAENPHEKSPLKEAVDKEKNTQSMFRKEHCTPNMRVQAIPKA
jgi:hypothetical protein